jgi:hypothetical protein
MTIDGSSIVRLREYLQCLSPEARAMLIAELELAQLRGENVAGSELVLRELRQTIRSVGQPVPIISASDGLPVFRLSRSGSGFVAI